MPNSTTNYAFNLPLVNDPIDADLWGTQLNANWSSLDTLLNAVGVKTGGGLEVSDSLFRVVDNADATKKLAFEVSGIGTGTTRTITVTNTSLAIPANATAPSSLVLAEDTDNGSNTATIIAPAALGGNRVLTLPDATGEIISSARVASDTVAGIVELATAAEVRPGVDTGRVASVAEMQANKIVYGTAVASTSGTTIDFGSIPSWTNRITVFFSGVSTNGTSGVSVQIGDSGGIETTGYVGSFGLLGGSPANISTGFNIGGGAATSVRQGMATLMRVTGNTWAFTANTGFSDSGAIAVSGGVKSLSDALTTVRITSTNGTDTFDAGTVNVSWE